MGRTRKLPDRLQTNNRPTQSTAISRAGGSGGPDPLNITAGGMLVGISAAAFAWSGRNRVRAH